MKLFTKIIIKHGNGVSLCTYLEKNYRELSRNEIDMIVDNFCSNGAFMYQYEVARILNNYGYYKKVSNIIHSMISHDSYTMAENNMIYHIMKHFDNLSKEDFELLKTKFLENMKKLPYGPIIISDYFNYIVTSSKLSKDKQFVRNFIISTGNKLDFDGIFRILKPGIYENFVDNTVREYLTEVASNKYSNMVNNCPRIYNGDEREDAVLKVFDYYTREFPDLKAEDKYIEDKLNKEKENMLEYFIDYAPKGALAKLIVDDEYILEKDTITYIIDRLIDVFAYPELIQIISKKIQVDVHGINNISDSDVNKIIDNICKTYAVKHIYDLAKNIWNYTDDKQRKSIRRSISKSNDPEYIIKFSLYIDEEMIPSRFKKIENFYNYVKENETDELKGAREEILDPKLLTLEF